MPAAKILCACANGSGTSLMMQMTVERVAKKLNMDVAQVHHCALAEGTSTATSFDVACFPRNFENMFKSAAATGKVVCIPLRERPLRRGDRGEVRRGRAGQEVRQVRLPSATRRARQVKEVPIQ